MVDAAEALDVGLVNGVFSRDELLPATEKLAHEIIVNARLALEYSLEAVRRGLDMTLDDGLFREKKAPVCSSVIHVPQGIITTADIRDVARSTMR